MFPLVAFFLGLAGVHYLASSKTEAPVAPPAGGAAPTPPTDTHAPTETAPLADAPAAPPASPPIAPPSADDTGTVDFGVPDATSSPSTTSPGATPNFVKVVGGLQVLDEGKVPDLPARLNHYQTQGVEKLDGGVRRIVGLFSPAPVGDKSVFHETFKLLGPVTLERAFMEVAAVSAVMSDTAPATFEVFIIPTPLIGKPFGAPGDAFVRVD